MSFSFTTHDPVLDAVTDQKIEDLIEPAPESDFARMADLLSSVLCWLAEGRQRNTSGLRNSKTTTRRYFCAAHASLRAVAMIYVIRLDLLGHSLREVGARCKCSPEAIRKHVDDFREGSTTAHRGNGPMRRERV